MNTQAIGAVIRQRREELGIDQQRLADLAGLSRHGIVNLESGTGNPRFSTLETVAACLGLELRLEVRPPGAPASVVDGDES